MAKKKEPVATHRTLASVLVAAAIAYVYANSEGAEELDLKELLPFAGAVAASLGLDVSKLLRGFGLNVGTPPQAPEKRKPTVKVHKPSLPGTPGQP